MSQDFATSPEHFWMPFTANRQFKASPRLLERAEGMYYTASDGRQVPTARPGCGAAMPAMAARDQRGGEQADRQDGFRPTFQMGHPLPFELAEKSPPSAPRTEPGVLHQPDRNRPIPR